MKVCLTIALIVFYSVYAHSQVEGASDNSEFSSDDPAQKDFGQKEKDAAEASLKDSPKSSPSSSDEFGQNDSGSVNPPAPDMMDQPADVSHETIQENTVRKTSNDLSRAHGVSSKLKAKIEVMDKSIEVENSKAISEQKETIKEIKQIVQLQSQLSIRQKRVGKLRAQIKAAMEKNQRLKANTAKLFAQIKNLAIEEHKLLQQKIQYAAKEVIKKDVSKKEVAKKDITKKDINRQLASKTVKPDPRQGPRHN